MIETLFFFVKNKTQCFLQGFFVTLLRIVYKLDPKGQGLVRLFGDI